MPQTVDAVESDRRFKFRSTADLAAALYHNLRRLYTIFGQPVLHTDPM